MLTSSTFLSLNTMYLRLKAHLAEVHNPEAHNLEAQALKLLRLKP